jgi:S-adenosylmethionine hydrolase
MNTITVLTDFGYKDPYAGVMKGVMLAINPQATIVDITHEVDPQDVQEGCFLVPEYFRYFSTGTVHLCVVDPTVGSHRKPLVLSHDGHFFVGPDNGLFSFLLDHATAREITNTQLTLTEVSPTFHGRDIFAPAAAHLSRGILPAEFGPIVEKPVRLDGLAPEIQGSTMTGKIVRFDHFGNAISNIPVHRFRDFAVDTPFFIQVGGLTFDTLSVSYFEGDYTCVAGSSGFLEFALFRGSLIGDKGVGKGDAVTITRFPSSNSFR